MDIQKKQKQREGSEDENDNFEKYMDENGIIRTEEQGGLRLDEQGILTLEEEGPFRLQEQRIPGLDEELFLELDQQSISHPQPHSDEDRSDTQSWEEHFSFSQLSEERNRDLLEIENSRTSDIITEQHETDGQSSEDHPGVSVSLPPPLDWRPPSRDQQLDMTEDEQDRGSFEGKWGEEEEENWSQEPPDLPYDESPVRFEENGDTSGGEEQWEESYTENQGFPEDEPNTFSIPPSPQPIPRPWGQELINHIEGLTISPGIEDETLPESLYTDSGDGTATTPPEGRKRIASKQTKSPKSESTFTPSRTWHGDDANMKTSKTSTTPVYGRGQLNYPLPDLSKVGPRVKLPREDQIYRPPQPRRLETLKQATPVVFKSPAEIVREVLLSSTEISSKEPVVPLAIPQEFKTPKQATELVHRLQEDYHKLLTKYAEAENTIDRLRLGAKVNLYSDPPKPSQSVQMGTVLHGLKPMEITIPKLQTATFSTVNEQHEGGSGSPVPSNPAVLPQDQTSPTVSPALPDHSPEDITYTLTSNIDLFQQEVDEFEKLWRDGKLTPGEQQQALWELRGSLGALERQYLKAREEYRQGKQYSGAGQPPEELDPHRVLEGAIFQLGVRLDELQDKVRDSTLPTHPTEQDVNQEDMAATDPLHAAPLPAVAPIPVLLTPYPEVLPPTEDSRQTGADMASMTKVVAERDEDLPQPLRHKHMQVEREYDTLLSTYNNFKTLPDALGLEQDEWPQYRQQDTMPNHHPETANAESHPQLADPEEHFLTKRVRDQPQAIRSKDHPHSITLQGHQKVTGHNSHSQVERPVVHQQVTKRQEHPKSAGPQDRKQSVRAEDDQLLPRPSSELTPRHVPSNRGHRGESHGPDRHQPSPDAGRYKTSKSVSSKDSAAHVSRRSPSVSRLNKQSPRSPAADFSVSGDSTRSPYSRRSSVGSKSASSLAQKEQPKDYKRTSVQDRILSPETDSGFLGSESGRSPQLRKLGEQMQSSREVPAEVVGSRNSYRRNEVSRTESDPRSRPHKTLWGKRQQSNQWAGPSEASSPSLGPKSLTESETRGQSSDSDSERDMCSHDIINEPTSNDPVPLFPVGEASQHLRSILETRTARDQAIQDLQKEVIQLRQHLENSLSRPPAQERLGAPRHSSTFQNPQEKKAPHFPDDRVSSLSSSGVGLNEPRADLPAVPESGSNHYSQKRSIYGDYTGTLYQFPGTHSNHQTRRATVPFCERCQEKRNRSPGHPRAGAEVYSGSQVPSSCPVCHEGNDSTENHRTGLSNHQANRRSHRTRRHPPCGQWVLNHPPHVNYVQSPLIPYSSPVIYSPSSSIYVPMGYTVNELRPPSMVAPPPTIKTLDLDDLLQPLNRALEAAKELKVTSKRMCHSLASDLNSQRSFRRSCLF